MKINVCVNGAFRYPNYIGSYAAAGVLNGFHFAHRRSTDAAALGLQRAVTHNIWAKEYTLQAAWRALPGTIAARAERTLCDLWQGEVIRRWRDCDTVEAVIGAVSDRVLAHARRRGSRTLGHPVCAHPDTVAAFVGRAYADLGLDPKRAEPSDRARREAEIAACDHLLVDSAAVARSFMAAGVGRDRISVVTPTVDRRRFSPRNPDERDRRVFRIVCVATVTPRKAQHVLLQAWRQLRLPRAELILVGPPGRDARAVLRGYDGCFTHHTRVPNADLRALLVRASAFVLPSVEDGFAQAPLEAMACGVPVIVADTVGMSDLVEDGRNGFVVPAFAAEPIALRLEALYRDAAYADALGEAAAVAAAGLGGWDRYVGQVLALHYRLLDRTGEPAQAAA